MIKIDSADLGVLSEEFHNSGHSYFLLESVHGCSISELKVMLESPVALHYMDCKNNPRMLSAVFDVDQSQKHARLQLCAKEKAHVDLEFFLKKIKKSFRLERIYSYVFPEENLEIDYLKSAGFVYEAVFRQHIYVSGEYRDLLVFGQLEEKA